MSANPSTTNIAEEATPGLVWAYRFHADGRAERLASLPSIDALRTIDGWIWLHFSQADQRAQRVVDHIDSLPAAARKTLLAADEHVSLEVTEGVVHGIFVDLQRDLAGKTSDLGKLHFAFDDHLVVSMRRQALLAVDETRRRVDEGKRFQSAVVLFEQIVQQFTIAIEALMLELSEAMDGIEDRILQQASGEDRVRLIPIRRRSVKLHRELLALRSLLHRLEAGTPSDVPGGLTETAAILARKLDALDHEAVILQDRGRLLQEEMNAMIDVETNSRLHVLSVFTALLLPPTLIVGVFGMNTKDLPLAQTDGGFWGAIALCVASVYAAYVLLRRLKILP